MAKIKYIDLFAGCGGLSLGFEQANDFEAVAFVESGMTVQDSLKGAEPAVDTPLPGSWPMPWVML